jgi:ribosomal protein S18 acetylase RimI-like enzyme
LRSFTCFCGAPTIDAADLDALVPLAKAHLAETHDFKLTNANVRDYFEAEDRLSPVRPRLDEIGEVEMHAASTERLDDLLHFFDHEGFAGKPDWAACYCMAHHLGEGGADWCRARNRQALIDRIKDGTTAGFLAYADGNVAAWVNASARSSFFEYVGRDEHPDDKVGSVMCFVVAPPYRRHGLAERLLDTALESFAAKGLTIAEAYPNRDPSDDASAYHGPMSLYTERGFVEVGENGPLAIVQKTL